MSGTIEIPLTKGYTAIVDAQDAHLAKQKWHAATPRHTAYAQRGIKRGGKYTKIMLHHAVMGMPPEGMVVDHINGNGLDNRRCNLRFVSKSENMHNSRHGMRGLSKFPGVCFQRKTGKWMARISIGGERKYLGLFQSEKDAAGARMKAELELWGAQPRRKSAFHEATI